MLILDYFFVRLNTLLWCLNLIVGGKNGYGTIFVMVVVSMIILHYYLFSIIVVGISIFKVLIKNIIFR